MSGLVLLIIGLASLALVLAALAYSGLRAWRVVQRGTSFSRDVGPLADQLSDWSRVIEVKAQRLSEDGAQLAANVERLRASLQRLQIIVQSLIEATAPLRRLRDYLGM
jgi:hypothetical protein